MASTCCKVPCALILVLMILTETQGARIPGTSDHSKHRMSSEHDMVPLQLDLKALAPMKAVRALHNSSISPWTYRTSYNSSLFPAHISEAHCLLRGCLDLNGREDLSLESRPILHQILLLRRVRSEPGQAYHYRLEPRLIAVGCTCVQPQVQHPH